MSRRMAAVQSARFICGLLGIVSCVSALVFGQVPSAWVPLQDSSPEHAFALEVPKGWTAKAGTFRLGYSDVRELRWGEQTMVNGLVITAMGANHWGKRWPWGRAYGFNSYVLEKDGRRMLLACDSATTDLFKPLQANPPEVTAFSIGAYDPWIWNHADPEQVWTMFLQMGARYLVPIHWGTFRLSKEPMDEPLRRLIAAAGPESNRIVLRTIGAAWQLPEPYVKRGVHLGVANTP